MTLFMNFDSTTSPKRGSGRISRRSGRRRAIGNSFYNSIPARSARGTINTERKRRLIWVAWRRTSNGSACGPSHPAYRARREGRDSARRVGRAHGRRGSARRCAPGGFGDRMLVGLGKGVVVVLVLSGRVII